MPCSCSATCSLGEAISTGLTIGPPAWCSRSAARPSQNCAVSNTAFSTVGALQPPCCHLCPIEVGSASAPPSERLWHEAQLMTWLADSRGSKNNISPSSTLAAVASFPGSVGGLAGMGLKTCRALAIRGSAAAPLALGVGPAAVWFAAGRPWLHAASETPAQTTKTSLPPFICRLRSDVGHSAHIHACSYVSDPRTRIDLAQ